MLRGVAIACGLGRGGEFGDVACRMDVDEEYEEI